MTPIQTFKESNEKIVHSNLQNRGNKQLPKLKLGDLVRTANIKKVFSKGDLTNYSYNLYTITKKFHDTTPSYRIDVLPERCHENLLLPTISTLKEIIKVMKELNLIHNLTIY